MSTNITIKNIHGYGLLDLQEILEQCDYTVSEVSKRFNNIDSKTLFKLLIYSKEFTPLFDRSVELYTNGLLSLTNKFIYNNFNKLECMNTKHKLVSDLNYTEANNCMKIIVIAIWYRGLSQSDINEFVDIEKVVRISKSMVMKNVKPIPEVSDDILRNILKVGKSLDSIPNNAPHNVKYALSNYYMLKCVPTLGADRKKITTHHTGRSLTRQCRTSIVEMCLDKLIMQVVSGKDISPKISKQVMELNELLKMKVGN